MCTVVAIVCLRARFVSSRFYLVLSFGQNPEDKSEPFLTQHATNLVHKSANHSPEIRNLSLCTCSGVGCDYPCLSIASFLCWRQHVDFDGVHLFVYVDCCDFVSFLFSAAHAPISTWLYQSDAIVAQYKVWLALLFFIDKCINEEAMMGGTISTLSCCVSPFRLALVCFACFASLVS